MHRFTPVMSLWIIVALSLNCAAGDRDRERTPAPPLSARMRSFSHAHEGRRARATVTSMAFSPDGQWLVAAYFRHAMNRPGTDWGARVAQWNLATGKRIIIPNACGPVAISRGGVLAMNQYERLRMSPKTRLALWELGKSEPQRFLEMEAAALVFDPEGKRLLGLSSSWEIRILLIDGEEPAKAAGTIDREKLGLSQRRVGSATLAFEGRHDLRVVLAPMGVGERWHYSEATGFLNRRRPLTARLWPSELRPFQAVAFFWPGGARQNLTAFSGRGKVVVRRWDDELLATLPGNGQPAFSPDGRRIAVADRRGIIRIWQCGTGRLVKSLRLDDRPPETVLVAAVQCHSEFGKPMDNRERLGRLVRQAAAGGAAIVVLPETAVTGYMTADLKKTWQVGDRQLSEGLEGIDPTRVAETVPGPSTRYFARLADQFGIYLTVPLVETDPRTGKFYNTSVLLGPDGRMLIHYRKRDPWPWAERGWATPGDLGNPVVDTPWGRLGLLVCYDIHQQSAAMAERKIDMLLYSVAWVDHKQSDWYAKDLPDIAKKSGFHIVAANWTVPAKPAPTWHGYGQSRIIDATGAVLATARKDLGEEVVFAELPVGRPAAVMAPATMDELVAAVRDGHAAVVAASLRKNSSKMCGTSSAAMPMPWSLTAKVATVASVASDTSTRRPSPEYRMALLTRLVTSSVSPSSSAMTCAGRTLASR
jgi:predicted amidohydrolase